MAKYYRGHSKGGRFDLKSTGDLGLRAYKDQQQNIIDNLKLSQKQASDVNRDYLIAASNKTVREEKNTEEINRFEDNIYHSKLAEREELHFGNKWLKQKNLKEELFNSKKLLRKSIIVKEILDKPLAMRD